jgi:hypothetical protein
VNTPDVLPIVTSISISGDTSVDKGSSINLTANVVTDPAGADQSVTWSITTSGIAVGTGLSATTGSPVTLNVDASESQTSIEVKIVSNLDGTKTATKAIAVNSPLPPPTGTDFKTEANANLLGLYPGTDYVNGAAVISAMDARINTSFYNITTYGILVNPDHIYGITDVKADNVAGGSPAMAWFIHNDDLVVYGYAGHSTIVFNIAVINETTGQGWITGDGNNAPYGDTYLRTYSTGAEVISISDLTDGNITTAAGLSGYKVYVIVRWTDNFVTNRDLNSSTDYYVDKNVIAVTVP